MKDRLIDRIDWGIMTVIALLMCGLAFVLWPVWFYFFQPPSEHDLAIEKHLPIVSSALANYTEANGQPPATLADLPTLPEDTKAFIQTGAIDYTPHSDPGNDPWAALCVNFDTDNVHRDLAPSSSEWLTEIITGNGLTHHAGTACYIKKYIFKEDGKLLRGI